jgi:hypothetical protein
MQSIIQYHKFKQTVSDQIARHGLTASAGAILPPHLDLDSEPSRETGQRSGKDDESPSRILQPIASLTTTSQKQRQSDFAYNEAAINFLDENLQLGESLTGVEVRKRQTNEGGSKKDDVFLVGFSGDQDPLNPHNWSLSKRVATTFLVSSTSLLAGFASSADSAVIAQAKVDFGVSDIVMALATALYLVGFAFGALFAAPISETVGRNPVYITTLFLFMVFVMASGLAPNISAHLVFRPIAGFCFRFSIWRAYYWTHRWRLHRASCIPWVYQLAMDRMGDSDLDRTNIGATHPLPARNVYSYSTTVESCTSQDHYG